MTSRDISVHGQTHPAIRSTPLLLVASAEQVIRRMLQGVLQGQGYQVLTAGNGTEAVSLYQHHQPDLVLLDLGQPGAGAFATCARLRELAGDDPLPLMTMADLDGPETVERVFQAGATDFFAKPVDPTLLKVKVRQALRHRDTELALADSRHKLAHAQRSASMGHWVYDAQGHLQPMTADHKFFDLLTGLPNRRSFTDKLPDYMAAAEREERLLGVLFVGIDRFKNINDSLGHTVGDALLGEIAKRLSAVGEDQRQVARVSGDIFTVLVADAQTVHVIDQVAKNILQAFAEPFHLDGGEFYLSVSVGCAIYPLSNDSSDQLINAAESAMFQAKHAGGNRYLRFSAEMNVRSSQRLSLETSLRKALEREEFKVHYQPQIAVKDGSIVGMEALVRWERPGVGLVPPDDFIPIAEETGLIVAIGAWVMETAARQAVAWSRDGHDPLRMAINLSARQFEEHKLVQSVEQVIASTGILPHCLEMEITESSAMSNLDRTVATLNRFRELGVQVSMDDFGTGYSSLSYLHKMPLNALKIDRSFIADITDPSDAADLPRIIILMCQALGLNVVAEGVETACQMHFLQRHACSEAQGYYISAPLPALQIEAMLRERMNPAPPGISAAQLR